MDAADSPTPASTGARTPAAGDPALDWNDDSLARRAYEAMKREPVLFVTYGYLAVSALGLWASWWFYRGFDFNILEYMQGGDFLVAGVRRPMYALLFAIAVLYAMLLTWPERWRRRHPDRYARIAQRWWAPLVFPKRTGLWSWWGLSPTTGMVVGIAVMMLSGTAMDGHMRARRVLEDRPGRIDYVRVTLAGQATESGTARLLGTSSGFAFVYWPGRKQVEALPLANVSRIETLRRADVDAPAAAGAGARR